MTATDALPAPMIDQTGLLHRFTGMDDSYVERCSCGWRGGAWARHLDAPPDAALAEARAERDAAELDATSARAEGNELRARVEGILAGYEHVVEASWRPESASTRAEYRSLAIDLRAALDGP